MAEVSSRLISRVLPPAEWAEKLKGTSLEAMPLDPVHSGVVVVEDAGQVVACWAILTTVHVEGLWEAESHRGNIAVSRALLSTMVAELQRVGVPEALTQSLTPEVDKLIESAGGRKVPGATWVLPVKEL